VNEECAYSDLEFPIVLLTRNERRVLGFWCPKTFALIEETNRLELITLWNRETGHLAQWSRWFNAVRLRSTKTGMS
jgi:hypothetical protein